MARPRFTLRALLVLTTIASLFAWQGGIVWKRKAAMHASKHTFMLDRFIQGEPRSGRMQVNTVRALWGDEPVRLIYLVPGDDWEAERDRLQRLFPEAEIQVMHPLFEHPDANFY